MLNIDVEVVTIDSVLESLGIGDIDNLVVKVDVEGFGLRVLRGARRTIERFRPFILFEVHRTFDEEDEILALKMLKSLGYGFVVVEPGLEETSLSMHTQWRRGAYVVDRHDPVIGVVGLDYVGLAYALAFSLHGFRVVGVDVDDEGVEAVRSGDAEGFPREVIEKVIDRYLYVSTDYDDLRDMDVVFIAVNTPTRPDGSQDFHRCYQH